MPRPPEADRGEASLKIFLIVHVVFARGGKVGVDTQGFVKMVVGSLKFTLAL
jgi:hypothetical protein